MPFFFYDAAARSQAALRELDLVAGLNVYGPGFVPSGPGR